MLKPFIGRSWVSHLYLNVRGAATRAATVVQWYRSGKIDEWQLWEILSSHGHPFAHAQDAAAVYKVLGFVPHVGYPLTKLERS